MKTILTVLFLAIATIAASAASLTVAWDPSQGATGYKIERAPGNTATTSFVQIGTVTAPSTFYVDASLPASTAYSYRVKAFNTTTESAYSNVASGTTPAALPTPGNIKVSPTPLITLRQSAREQITFIASATSARPRNNGPSVNLAADEQAIVAVIP